MYRTTSLNKQSSSGQRYINTAGSNQNSAQQPGSLELRGDVYVSSPSSMKSVASPPNQAAESGVYVLTTSRSRKREIQPITAADPAQPIRPITAAISFKQLF